MKFHQSAKCIALLLLLLMVVVPATAHAQVTFNGSLDFGDVSLAGGGLRSVTISNPTTKPVIADISYPLGFSGPTPVYIGESSLATFNIVFAPATEGSYSGNISLTGSLSGNVSVTGNAIPYNWSVSNNQVTITGYVGSGGVEAIPATINGQPVTTIGQTQFNEGYGAFQNNTTISGMTIPDSVTSIAAAAFANCTAMKSLTLGNGLISLGESAFEGCTSLASVTLPNSLNSVGDYAFSGCSSLTSVTFGSGLASIGDEMFSNCGLTSVTIPSTVNSIGEDAFEGCPLTSVTISPGVASIGDGAFAETSLASVTIPSSVNSLGGGAFARCGNLKSVTIPSSITSIAGATFFRCVSLSSVTIPNSVISIGATGDTAGAFQGSGLTSVTIPSSVHSIGDLAFSGCSYLPSVTIPSSVTSIGVDAFSYCADLNNAFFQGNAPTMASGVFGVSPVVVSYNNGATGFTSPQGPGYWTDSSGDTIPTDSVYFSNLTLVANGMPQAATVTTNPPGLNVTFTYTDSNGNPVTAPTDIGTYTVVATIDQPGYSGSATATLTITPVFGFDISAYHLGYVLTDSDWQAIVTAGYGYVIVGTWSGYPVSSIENGLSDETDVNGDPVPIADLLLAGASRAGLKTGIYCNISYSRDIQNGDSYTGAWQVQNALVQAGVENWSNLKFVAIDVETTGYDPDSGNPLGTSTSDQRVARIADAIQEVRDQGFVPILYTSASQWEAVTGTTNPDGTITDGGSAEISGIPIWDSSYGQPTTSDLGTPAIDYEGIQSRLIKQYNGSPNPPGVTNYLPSTPGNYNNQYALILSNGLVEADLDSCTGNAFSLPNPGKPPSPPTLGFVPQNISGGAVISIGGLVENYSLFSDALATRIVAASLELPAPETASIGSALALLLPIKFNTIPAGGSAQLATSTPLIFLPSEPFHGRAVLKITFTCGGASKDAGGSGYTVTEGITIP